jgi:hypothetical protein
MAQQQGINEVQYGVVAILAMGIGLFSPPVGVGFYQTCLIAKSSSDGAPGRRGRDPGSRHRRVHAEPERWLWCHGGCCKSAWGQDADRHER